MKNFISKIPILGWFLRLINNILRLNNLKHTVIMQQKQLQDQKEQLQKQQQQLNALMNSIDSKVAEQISYQSVSFQQRIDQFIHDTKIDLKNEKL